MDKNEFHEFYGKKYETLLALQERGMKSIEKMEDFLIGQYDVDPIEHVKCRIKTPKSLTDKLVRKNLPATLDSAFANINDIVGFRIICSFIGEIYKIVDEIYRDDEMEVLFDKDYIKKPKPNGYRSYHIILKYKEGEACDVPFELQLRTISMDSWASLEHKLKYKKNVGNEKLIINELKRCADELASTDLSMQTIHDMIKKA